MRTYFEAMFKKSELANADAGLGASDLRNVLEHRPRGNAMLLEPGTHAFGNLALGVCRNWLSGCRVPALGRKVELVRKSELLRNLRGKSLP